MAAGDRCCAVGVVRLVLGDVFDRSEVLLEVHHGIEDAEGCVEYGRLEEHRIAWGEAKALVSAADWKAVLKFVVACEKEVMKSHAPAKGKLLVKFEEKTAGKPAAPFSPL
ncbi:MAG: hypothetical protein IT345_15810 [Trueperaceae bacterium]|nr:hypothetical protein [Trueperaceae bacterium]